MATYERDTRVRAPLGDVWAFHSTIDGLLAVTPDWMGMRVDAVRHPNTDQDDPNGSQSANALTSGTRVWLSVGPFDVGPRQHWVSRIVEREERDGAASLVDEMEDGPFPEWRHEHLFYGDGDESVVLDRVTYRTSAGTIGDRVASAFLEPVFRYRHRRTREILGGP